MHACMDMLIPADTRHTYTIWRHDDEKSDVRSFHTTCIHTYIHTYTHTYIHTHIHTHIHTYIHKHESISTQKQHMRCMLPGEELSTLLAYSVTLGMQRWNSTVLTCVCVRQTDKQTDRQTNKQTNTHTHTPGVIDGRAAVALHVIPKGCLIRVCAQYTRIGVYPIIQSWCVCTQGVGGVTQAQSCT